MDIRSLARSMYDPARMNSAYRDQKRRLRDAFTAEDAANTAVFGSIAQRSDPTRFGSIEGRFDGLFRPEDARALSGSSDLAAINELEETAALAETQRKAKLKSKLRRNENAFDYEGFEDMFGDLL